MHICAAWGIVPALRIERNLTMTPTNLAEQRRKLDKFAYEMAEWLMESDDYPCQIWEMMEWLKFRGYRSPPPAPEPPPPRDSEEWKEYCEHLSNTFADMLDDLPRATLEGSFDAAWCALSRRLDSAVDDLGRPERTESDPRSSSR